MSREIKRVPLDFDWPTDVTWEGYVCPPSGMASCPDCKVAGHVTGYGPWGCAVLSTFPSQASALSASDRALLDGLAAKNPHRERYTPWGYLDKTMLVYDLLRHLEQTLDLPPDALLCASCHGGGEVIVDAAQHAAAEAWESTEPPVGDGWQVWQTVGKGSPVSPVYPTAEALIVALSTVGTEYDPPVSREAAEAFVRMGWAPSGANVDGVTYDSIPSALLLEEVEKTAEAFVRGSADVVMEVREFGCECRGKGPCCGEGDVCGCAGMRTRGIAGDRCGSGNECGRLGCPECQQ